MRLYIIYFFYNRWTIKWNCFNTLGQIFWSWITSIKDCTITCRMNPHCLMVRSLICSLYPCWVVKLLPSRSMMWRPAWRSSALTFPITSVSNFSCYSIQVRFIQVESWKTFSNFFFMTADVKGLMNRRHVVEAQEQVQQALFDYTLNCYTHIPVSFLIL